MKIVNVHQRLLRASPEQVGALIDTLASPDDVLWPRRSWPRMAFDRPLGVGASGGHGPIRYTVEAYTPGESIRFRFDGPAGLDGWHSLDVLDATRMYCVLEHRIEARLSGWARLSWPLVYRPLHDALLEDALSLAQVAVGNEPKPAPWSPWVRLLRWVASHGGKRPRRMPGQHHAA